MRMPEQTEALWGINVDDRVVVHEGSDDSEVVVVKGNKTEKYSEFDIQIRLEGGRGYEDMNPPSHSHVFRDLHSKRISNPDDSSLVFEAIQSIYLGQDPRKYVELAELSFNGDLFPADVTVWLLQLMMIEQEINYGPGGNVTYYHPPRDLLMSCVRWIQSGEYDEIDEIIKAGCSGCSPKQFHFDGNKDEIWSRPKT